VSNGFLSLELNGAERKPGAFLLRRYLSRNLRPLIMLRSLVRPATGANSAEAHGGANSSRIAAQVRNAAAFARATNHGR
jgi:hypothetical protein